MKRILITFLIFLIAQKLNAQHKYDTALGLRFGYGTGFDIKHNLDESSSVEGLVDLQWHGLLITGLYEKNFPVIKQEEGFRFYMGGGAHLGFWNDYRNHPWYDDKDKRSHVALGIDGIIGLEYTFNEIPLNLAIDWIPLINIADYPAFWGGGVGLSVRYAIK